MSWPRPTSFPGERSPPVSPGCPLHGDCSVSPVSSRRMGDRCCLPLCDPLLCLLIRASCVSRDCLGSHVPLTLPTGYNLEEGGVGEKEGGVGEKEEGFPAQK